MVKNCSLKKCISKKYPNIALLSKTAFQNFAPSKNVFQNCYKLSIENKNRNLVGQKTLDV